MSKPAKRAPQLKRSAARHGDPRRMAIMDRDVIAQVRAEAKRQDRSMSWIVQQCVRLALPKLRKLEPEARS
jgi:uncharacterized small protein (TIGR04563 family)